MKSLKTLCEPRESVFDAARRDTVLNLTHLVDGKIDAHVFFEENFVTEGMKVLLEEAFRRLQGHSAQAIFKLTQAMGGGKTHNLITLGLLAKHPEYRRHVLDNLPDAKALPEVRVVAFSGRETDIEYGIWGEIARQLGKFEVFRDHYQPLKAPGRSAWTRLFDGEPTLILLDELPPYLDNARAIGVGNSDLAKVTAAALTNLFEAAVELPNVCVVLTDLVGTYADASSQIQRVLEQLQHESQRHAMDLTPVRMNTDEFYHVLRKRLFKVTPDANDVAAVAQEYTEAIRKAKQMDITSQSPEQFGELIRHSYPFHPAIKDLYARFKENRGFQQTRALIRLMRIITSRLWTSGEAERKQLICVHDIDLNDPETLSEIRQINPTLDTAISHDIAAQGRAVAELMDQNLGGSDTVDACRLIFMSSLANVPNAVVGLSIPEIVTYLSAPGRDLTRLKGDVLEKLATAAWYLHANRDGKLYFKNVENLNAKLESLSRGYIREQSLKELREQLTELFKPVNRSCYQDVLVLPSPDEIQLSRDQVTLVISEPTEGQGLNSLLREFWDKTTFKNRFLCLTGSRNTFEDLLESAKRLKAIRQIIDDLRQEGVAESDPQFKQADELRDRLLQQFLSAVKETFSTLWYPTRRDDQDGLQPADFLMKFHGNRYNGEEQILQTLKDKQKYTEDVTGEIFAKKVESRLFTQLQMPWANIKYRAAIQPVWQWHPPDALEKLKAELVKREIWREDRGGYVDRRPPPPKTTSVQIQELGRDPETGKVTLKVIPVHGDTVYAEVGAEATRASHQLDGQRYETDELQVSFLCVDSSGGVPTGPATLWKNRIELKYRFFDGPDGSLMLELKALPDKGQRCTICYTTDGSNPRVGGGRYASPFRVDPSTLRVLAVATCDGVESEVKEIDVRSAVKHGDKRIDRARPASWRRHHRFQTTDEVYAFLDRLKKHDASASGLKITVSKDRLWVEISLHDDVVLDALRLYETVDFARKLVDGGTPMVEAAVLHFKTGQALFDWASEVKTQVDPEHVDQ